MYYGCKTPLGTVKKNNYKRHGKRGMKESREKMEGETEKAGENIVTEDRLRMRCEHRICIVLSLNPKRAGLFGPISQLGWVDSAPLRSRKSIDETSSVWY